MAATPQAELYSSRDRLNLGVCHLPRLWQRAVNGLPQNEDDWIFDNILLHGLGLPIEETYKFLFTERPEYSEFEDWALRLNGGAIEPAVIERINAAIEQREPPLDQIARFREIDEMDPVLSDDDLAFWDEHGYVIVQGAITPRQCHEAANVVREHIGADADDPSTWYSAPRDHGIMQQFFRHPALDTNRRSDRIHKAFAQLWGTADLWTTCDRVSFNPPVTADYPFPGPRLHWDVSLSLPIPFGVQGLIYLTDTPAERGAFTCVPGFHRTIDKWIAELPAGTDPRNVDLDPVAKPIDGGAGDLVIWHQALPHGSRPNTSDQPRIVQYVSMFAAHAEYAAEWK
ncbi:MAG TPA: phytanoyl-CoA dioxygenase family protein [Pyrinomonadaceae bacterium]|nr:phytanoyl-CoA dioxygenase family protein [Pyrinomonadaceae bacterium]